MTKQEVIQELQLIEWFYGREFLPSAVQGLLPEFVKLPRLALREAGEELAKEHKAMPGPGQILVKAREVAGVRSTEFAREENRRHSQEMERAFQEGKNIPLVKDSLGLIREMMIGAVTRQEALDRLERLDRLYPGLGFDRAKKSMEDRLARMKLPLGKTFGSHL
jgi:hypothetical protein